ncbi:Hybrid signal transduction histidine kinase I [Hordeum vulgare]|nr:Hybrid signal transduction histidine kinase I [Hordeum vulgare]
MASSLKALLVDDMAVERMVASAMLRKFHCEITMAKNGKEAVDMFLEGNEFDIVVAVEKIRAMGATGVKIVGVSADDNAMEAFMSAGADDFVPKPVRPEILGPIIQDVINRKSN